jgi:hypothetical protein
MFCIAIADPPFSFILGISKNKRIKLNIITSKKVIEIFEYFMKRKGGVRILMTLA